MAEASLPPELAARFEARGVVGEGSFGRVVRATRREDGLDVAIKLLAADADMARFAREAEAGARLDHPNLVRTLEAGAVDGAPYLVLPFYPGGTLEDRLVQGCVLTPPEAARLLDELLAGLEAAHGEGVLHRDLKAANVLFAEDGRAVIADLGLARVVGQQTLTKTGWMVGTPRTMPPEQFLGGAPAPSWDLYAAGVVYLHALTGIQPFEGGSPGDILEAKRRGDIQGLGEVSRLAGPGRADLLEAWLGPDPSRRPADVAAARRALAAAAPPRRAGPEAVSTVVPAPPTPPTPPTPPSPGPSGARRGAGVLGLLLAAAGVAWWARPAPGPPPVATRLELGSESREAVRALAEVLSRAPAIEELLSSTEPRRTPAFEARRARAVDEADALLRGGVTPALLDELAAGRLDLDLVEDLGRVLLRLRLVYRERDGGEYVQGGGEALARLEEVYARVVRIRRLPELSDYPRGTIDWEARRRSEGAALTRLGGDWACRRSRADWPEYDVPGRVFRSARLLKVNLAGQGFLPQREKGTTALITDLFRGDKAAEYDRKIELDQPEARIGPLRHPEGSDLFVASRSMGWEQTVQGVVEVVGEDSLTIVVAVPYEYFPPPAGPKGDLHTPRTGWMLWVSAEVLPRGVELLRLRPVGLQALGPPHRTVSLELAWHREGGELPRVEGLVGPS